MVVAPSGRNGTLCHLPRVNWKVLTNNNNITTLGYTYAKLRINDPPNIFYKLAHIGRIIVCIPWRFSWTPSLWGKNLPWTHHIFSVKNKHSEENTLNWKKIYINSCLFHRKSTQNGMVRKIRRVKETSFSPCNLNNLKTGTAVRLVLS